MKYTVTLRLKSLIPQGHVCPPTYIYMIKFEKSQNYIYINLCKQTQCSGY